MGKLTSVTRIIAGFAGSHRLRVPSNGTRPTSDRVREAIFSAVAARSVLSGARVLDLYAGSGALGLEAASRGAGQVVLVENNRAAARIIQANAELVRRAAHAAPGTVPEITVAAQAVQTYLDAQTADRAPFDLVFIDPPYEVGNDALLKNLERLVPLLSSEAIVVIERASRTGAPLHPSTLELVRQKPYGDTALYWLEPVGA